MSVDIYKDMYKDQLKGKIFDQGKGKEKEKAAAPAKVQNITTSPAAGGSTPAGDKTKKPPQGAPAGTKWVRAKNGKGGH